jgi:IMP cyclohydrolase
LKMDKTAEALNNPNGPYPGRQIFLGLTEKGSPCFAYLVTGRSPASRERRAVFIDDVVRIGPIGDAPYDPLRHYSAVKYDKASQIATVSNGIQTEAIYETYRLLYNTGSSPGKDYMEKILDGAGAEPDSLHTPRIAGIITFQGEKASPVIIAGMVGYSKPAAAYALKPGPGSMVGISTYTGDMEKPLSRDTSIPLAKQKFAGNTAQELASYLFDISYAAAGGNDIRVCTVSGVLSGGKWDLAIRNVHNA